MMKRLLIKVTTSVLLVAFISSNVLLVSPEKASAQGAASCTAGYVAAGLSALAAVPQNILGVPKSQVGDTAQDVVTGGSTNAMSFNNCILKPLGQMMVISLIRNIGASIVDWVNSGFQGKPSFVTDFGGTLIDAADQAIGQFIEGTDLDFLCGDFSFQIRIQLALKYSRPYREEIRCTLSGIGDNVNNFVENNGGAGWDNWLDLTTEPNNNVYGAYLMADSELAQKALTATGLVDKKISFGGGFLDFETCDRYETTEEVNKRLKTVTQDSVGNTTGGGTFETEVTRVGAETTKSTVFNSNQTIEPQCLKKTVKTPGRTIAAKLDSVLGQGEIQSAVADEIDEVIAATLNQLAIMAIQGASGLLGLSKKSSYSGSSYINRYRAELYNGGSSGSGDSSGDTYTLDLGASSAIDSYRVTNYDESEALLNNPEDEGLQDIYDLAEDTAKSASDAQKDQINAIVDKASTGSNTNPEANLALLESTSISSGNNEDDAVDGIPESKSYSQGAITSEKQSTNPWWEVDLGKDQQIDEVRIYRPSNKQARQTLGTFRVIIKRENGTQWRSGDLNGNVTANPVKVTTKQTGRYVRIEKNALSYKCGYRNTDTCYYPLHLAEVKVIKFIKTPTDTDTSTGTGSDTQTENPEDTTSTQIPNLNKTISAGQLASVTLPIGAATSMSIPALQIQARYNNQPISFGSLFNGANLAILKSGQTNNVPIGDITTIRLERVPAGGSYNTKLIFSGTPPAGIRKGSGYEIIIEERDSSENIVNVSSINFVVE